MQRLKKSVLLCFLVVIATLIISTLVDPLLGTSGVAQTIYGSTLFTLLWAVLAVLAVCLIVRVKLWTRPATLLIHAAFLVILAGALITHLTGRQGTMHIRNGQTADVVELGHGDLEKLPFSVTLTRFDVDYYPGTSSPQDYRSLLRITHNGDATEAQVSMNKIVEYGGYRFYQSGYDPDQQGTQLMVTHDPWGIGVTYCGYLLLLVAMIGYFLEPKSRFRQLLRQPAAALLLLLMALPASTDAKNMPKIAPTDVAEQMGDLYIFYNGRVAPMETFAHDFTTKLCGSDHYRSRMATEVLAGWVFFPDTWKEEPMLKIKGAAKRAIGKRERMVSLRDMANHVGDYKLQPLLDKIRQGETVSGKSDLLAADEKVSIINGLFTGAAMKIFPIRDKKGNVEWYAAVDKLPDDLDIKRWTFIRKSMDLVTEKVVTRRYSEARELLQGIKRYQEKECGEQLPTAKEVAAEKTYNKISSAKVWAMACITIGLLSFVYCIWLTARRRMHRWVSIALHAGLLVVWCYLSYCMVLRWQISHHLPLSNGFEVMQGLAWCCFLITGLLGRRMLLALPFGYLVGGLALLVSMIGQSNPSVTQLMPVLQSPLLSLHVMVIMVAYALLAFVMLNGVAALILSRARRTGNVDAPRQLQRTSLLMLYPAVFLLTIGIFIGAVGANVSWGRYWGWDPKEVWALITMMIYALPLPRSLTWLQPPRRFHWFCVLAFLAVLMTYFGVNFFLPGMHSYA